jgi:enoyl-CoA hydratase
VTADMPADALAEPIQYGEVSVTPTAGHVAIVSLNAPDRRNAITRSLADDLVAVFDRIEGDEAVRAAVVTGAGPAFCAGADLSALQRAKDPSESERLLRSIYSAFVRVRSSTLPTVAAVRGPAVGAGLNLAMACDLRVAGRTARFDSRFLRLGLHPGGGASWLLRSAVGRSTAAAMLLFDEVIDGADAERLGLAWRCVPDEDVVDRAVELARQAARAPRALSHRIKSSLDDAGCAASHHEALEIELVRQLWSFAQPRSGQQTA